MATCSPKNFSRYHADTTSFETDLKCSHGTKRPSTRGRAFVEHNGRKYLADPDLPYPLPFDLSELHRQSLKTLLLTQYYGAPVTCPTLKGSPPKHVLELGCGPGFWSMLSHQYYKNLGHTGISFTGVDIASVTAEESDDGRDTIQRDQDMEWRFRDHDLTMLPWPFPDESFDLVMNKDMSMAVTLSEHPLYAQEALRVLKRGGVLEIWVADHMIRRIRPHAPEQDEEQKAALRQGAYAITMSTPFAAPRNQYLAEYNRWLSQAMGARQLRPNPCTSVAHYLYQESEILCEVSSRRVALPLSEIEWECGGIDNIVNREGKIIGGLRARPMPFRSLKKPALTANQKALRSTAMLTLVQEIQALELLLRPASGKNQDEWDLWVANMSNDLMAEDGARSGECIEYGAWWCRKKY